MEILTVGKTDLKLGLKLPTNSLFLIDYQTRHISDSINVAIDLAKRRKRMVTFVFNEIIISVLPSSNASLIERDFVRASGGLIPNFVGPHPSEKLKLWETSAVKKARIKDRG